MFIKRNIKMAKQKDNTIAWILVIGILLFVYLSSQGYFKSININQDTSDSSNSAANSQTSETSENSENSACTDSDGGKIFNIGGKVTTALGSFYDSCQPNQMDLLEYYCENSAQKSIGIGCINGCIDSSNGDYCSPNKIWHAGDTVFSGSGTGTLTGTNNIGSIDLSEYGIEPNGNCKLGAQIQTSWTYDNPGLCQGVWGVEGIRFDFYDSNGLEYSRTDANPLSLGVDLHPAQHNLEWDGTNLWKGEISKVPNILPNCQIDYEYSLRIYIYSCS